MERIAAEQQLQALRRPGEEAGQMYIDARESGSGAAAATGLAISQGVGRVSGGMGVVEFYEGEPIVFGPDGTLMIGEFESVADWALHGGTSYVQVVTTASGATYIGGQMLTSKTALQIAQAGGRHAGFLKNYAGKSPAELRRAMTSLQKQIAEHQAKIANPEKFIPSFRQLDPRQQAALLKQKWPADIQRQQEQLQIIKALLGEN